MTSGGAKDGKGATGKGATGKGATGKGGKGKLRPVPRIRLYDLLDSSSDVESDETMIYFPTESDEDIR